MTGSGGRGRKGVRGKKGGTGQGAVLESFLMDESGPKEPAGPEDGCECPKGDQKLGTKKRTNS